MSVCGICGVALLWLRGGEDHWPFPVNADPDPEGTIIIRTFIYAKTPTYGVMLPSAHAREGDLRYMPHCMTCPESQAPRPWDMAALIEGPL